MSLMKSLARVAAGVLVAKGMSAVIKNASASRSGQTAGQASGTQSRRSLSLIHI